VRNVGVIIKYSKKQKKKQKNTHTHTHIQLLSIIKPPQQIFKNDNRKRKYWMERW